MSWQCQCGGTNDNSDVYCNWCGRPSAQAGSAQQGADAARTPAVTNFLGQPAESHGAASYMQPVKPPASSAGWKIGLIACVLALGVVFGGLVGNVVFRRADAASATPAPDKQSTFQQAFDVSFRNSCRQSAMRSASISRAAAESYCDCALSVIKQKGSAAAIIQTCKQRLGR